MTRLIKDTRERILEASRVEFLCRGYRGASLRNISKEAGVSTGPFYWHFKNKEELYDAIVGVHVKNIMSIHNSAVHRFNAMSEKEQKRHLGRIGEKSANEMLRYAYRNLDDFKILLTASAGTKYEDFIHDITVCEIEANEAYIKKLKQKGEAVMELDPMFQHIIISGMFTSMFEMIVHDIPEERAMSCLHKIIAFYIAGWKKIIGL